MEEIKIQIEPNYCTYNKYKEKHYFDKIKEMLSEIGFVEIVKMEEPDGCGFTLWEIISVNVIIDESLNVTDGLPAEIGKMVANKFTEWVKMRNQNGDGTREVTQVAIYGENNSVLQIIEIDKEGNRIDKM